MAKSESTGLTPTEIAALTARVPCSGNPEIDAIITQSLRFSVATEVLAAALAGDKSIEYGINLALRGADALLEAFRKPPIQ
jgi:hypothetical protein